MTTPYLSPPKPAIIAAVIDDEADARADAASDARFELAQMQDAARCVEPVVWQMGARL